VWWEWLIVLAAVGIAGGWSARLVYRRIRQGARVTCNTCELRGPSCPAGLVQIQPEAEPGVHDARGDRGEAES